MCSLQCQNIDGTLGICCQRFHQNCDDKLGFKKIKIKQWNHSILSWLMESALLSSLECSNSTCIKWYKQQPKKVLCSIS